MPKRTNCKWCCRDNGPNLVENYNHEQVCIWNPIKQASLVTRKYQLPPEISKQIMPIKAACGNLTERSYSTNEFAIEQCGPHDDFLNTTLQTLWMFPYFQSMLFMFSREKSGPEHYKPLISAIQDFYSSIYEFHLSKQQTTYPVYQFDTTRIRKELFKIGYIEGSFILNQPGQAFEAHRYLLQVMHRWQKDDSSCIEKDDDKEPCCIVHKLFHINHKQVRTCDTCAIQKKIETPEERFAETVNVKQLVIDLDYIGQAKRRKTTEESLRQRYTPKQIRELAGSYIFPDQFFKALGAQFRELKMKECTTKNPQPQCISSTSNQMGRVSTIIEGEVELVTPEVLTFNLDWEQNHVTRGNLMSVLCSIPSSCCLKDLFNDTQTQISDYWIRGMVCAKEGRHHSYFRRTLLKKNFITERLKRKEKDEFRTNPSLLHEEITPETEWVKFDGDSVSYVKENWAGVIAECLENNIFPKQMFYEKPWKSEDTQWESPDFNQFQNDQPTFKKLIDSAEIGRSAEIKAEPLADETFQSEFQAFRSQFKDDNIYVFPCHHCPTGLMLLHEKKCLVCTKLNPYYDKSIKVDSQTWSAAEKELRRINKGRKAGQSTKPLASQPSAKRDIQEKPEEIIEPPEPKQIICKYCNQRQTSEEDQICEDCWSGKLETKQNVLRCTTIMCSGKILIQGDFCEACKKDNNSSQEYDCIYCDHQIVSCTLKMCLDCFHEEKQLLKEAQKQKVLDEQQPKCKICKKKPRENGKISCFDCFQVSHESERTTQQQIFCAERDNCYRLVSKEGDICGECNKRESDVCRHCNKQEVQDGDVICQDCWNPDKDSQMCKTPMCFEAVRKYKFCKRCLEVKYNKTHDAVQSSCYSCKYRSVPDRGQDCYECWKQRVDEQKKQVAEEEAMKESQRKRQEKRVRDEEFKEKEKVNRNRIHQSEQEEESKRNREAQAEKDKQEEIKELDASASPKSRSSNSSRNSSSDNKFEAHEGPPTIEMQMSLMNDFKPKEAEEIASKQEVVRENERFKEEEAKKEKIRKEKDEQERLEVEKLQNGQAAEPSSSDMLIISQNDGFVGENNEIYFTPSGEMIDARSELDSMTEQQSAIAHDMVLQNIPLNFIAQSLGLHDSTIKLLAQKADKEKHQWTKSKIKMLKQYMRKKIVAKDIASLLSMPLDKVEDQIQLITNSNKKPIKDAQVYKTGDDQEHKTYIPNFVTASIAIDEHEQPIKMSTKKEKSYHLYSGNCSCTIQNQHNANFLVLGPSGAGKTTFVDSFVNFVLGMEVQDSFRYRLANEKQIENQRNETLKAQGKDVSKGSAQTMSMTSTVTIYHIPSDHIVNKINSNNCCVNLIDTPGFGDTRGMAWDIKIFNMISNLLNSLSTLDYMLMVVKATENRLTPSTKFIYKQISKLYTDDLEDRMLGVFTFSDASQPQGYTAIAAAGIKLTEKFKFNNSAMFRKCHDDFTMQYFEMGEENFNLFVEFIKQKNALPISLNQNKSLLAKRKQMQELLVDSKMKSKQAIGNILGIAALIVEAQLNMAKFNQVVNLKKKVSIGTSSEVLDVNDLKMQYGQMLNSQLFVIGYIDKLILLTQKLLKYQTSFKTSSDILAQDSVRKDFSPNDFFLEQIDDFLHLKTEDWFKHCKQLLKLVDLFNTVRDELSKKGSSNEDQVIAEAYSRFEGEFQTYKQQVLQNDFSGIELWVKVSGVGIDPVKLTRMQTKFEEQYDLKQAAIRRGESSIKFATAVATKASTPIVSSPVQVQMPAQSQVPLNTTPPAPQQAAYTTSQHAQQHQAHGYTSQSQPQAQQYAAQPNPGHQGYSQVGGVPRPQGQQPAYTGNISTTARAPNYVPRNQAPNQAPHQSYNTPAQQQQYMQNPPMNQSNQGYTAPVQQWNNPPSVVQGQVYQPRNPQPNMMPPQGQYQPRQVQGTYPPQQHLVQNQANPGYSQQQLPGQYQPRSQTQRPQMQPGQQQPHYPPNNNARQ